MHALTAVDANKNSPYNPLQHRMKHGNSHCFDCGEQFPEWVSLGFGIFVCLDCAGHHRSLGVHITMVRAAKLDIWYNEHYQCLEHGGNSLFDDYLSVLPGLLHNSQPSASLFAKTKNNVRKYGLPRVLYYSEILKARTEQRPPIPYDDAYWSNLVRFPSMLTSAPIPVWTADSAQSCCSLCDAPFTLLNRRHHCRRCGKLACNRCAPKDNARPIMEWGMKQPVRHCRACFRSPAIDWDDLN